MAKINGLYVCAEEESISYNTTICEHPVEKGMSVSDRIKNEATTVSVTGKIVDTNKYKAKQIIDKIRTLQEKGSYVRYIGMYSGRRFLIESFEPSYSADVWGGANFSLSLKQVKVAKLSYKSKTKQNAKKNKKIADNPKLTVGSKVIFSGKVYATSTATKAKATKTKSTCKIISIASGANNPYKVKSTDGKGVDGWCKKSQLSGVGTVITKSKTKGTKKQVVSK